MKFCCFLDEDGHFRLTSLNEKEKTLKTLKDVDGGDTFVNITEMDGLQTPDLNCSTKDWEDYLTSFTARGRFEIVQL